MQRVAPEPDIKSCDREPIHIPGSIQPFGGLFVLDPEDHAILQVALGDPTLAEICSDPIGRPITQLLPEPANTHLSELLARIPERGALHLGTLDIHSGLYHVIGHRSDGCHLLELEMAVPGEPGSFEELYPQVRDFLDILHRSASLDELVAATAREVRRITGLDRVLVYRFDENWKGAVIAEDRNEALPSYLGLHFPASDIPAQARELYRLNRLRLISDAGYRPAAIEPALNPRTARPIDLSHAVLRSVSPVHLEYMRNMGTMASMSVSLLRDERLWGLISCHSRDARRVGYPVRLACDFIGQLLSMQLAAQEAAFLAARREVLRVHQRRLLAAMAAADHFLEGLTQEPGDLLGLTDAAGAAVVSADGIACVGVTPCEDHIRRLVGWLAGQQREDLYVTDSIGANMGGVGPISETASGVLAISISQLHDSYLLWFRPEWVRTVTWGGDPRKPVEPDGPGFRLNPRKSFEAWQETVRGRSRPWQPAEIEAASDLRTAIVDIVLRKAEEMAAVSQRLAAINKELEAFSYSVSHDLRAPFRHIVGYAQLLRKFEGDRLTERGLRYIDTIIDSALSAGTLVDDLLSFSQMGRTALTPVRIDMNALVADVRRRLQVEGERAVDWRIANLAPVRADPMMLRLVMQNLLDNALKFSRHRDPAIIEIGCVSDGGETIFHVKDNGAGFDMAYVGKLFGVFQRLHRVEEFEGTGIGLANVQRIIQRHGGRVWAEGRLDAGATFFFALPKEDTE